MRVLSSFLLKRGTGTMRGFVVVLALIWPGMSLGQSVIASAQFTDPTNRYPHNVLGDVQGFVGLAVTLTNGSRLDLTLPTDRVFEDIAPRLWDIDGDGLAEVIAVESDQRLGARLTAWTVSESAGLTLRAAGDFIGTRFRWLAPIGVGDFFGNGRLQIAYVAMPHLVRQLVLVDLQGTRFVPVARLDGVSNHKIGQDFITSAVKDCPNGPVIVLPSGDWQRVVQVAFVDGQPQAKDLGPLRHDSFQTVTAACAAAR